ncbi:MAG: hypothetical protein ABRQ25_12720 [Clostridiaceae bacterium]
MNFKTVRSRRFPHHNQKLLNVDKDAKDKMKYRKCGSIVPIKCQSCEHLLFEVDDTLRELVTIKLSGTAVYTFNLRIINTQMKGSHKVIKKGKKYFFDVINSNENIVKIMCPICKKFYLINLDKGTWKEVGRNEWPAA